MATKKAADAPGTDQVLGECLADFAQDENGHKTFVGRVEDNYKAYLGFLEPKSKAAGWTSKQHPPHVHQVIETEVASMVDAQPTWKVSPRPRMASPEEIAQYRDGARANELLLDQQADCDRLGEKEIVNAKQALIAGLSVYKPRWDYREVPAKRKTIIHEEVLHPETGQLMGYQPKIGVSQFTKVAADDNTVDVIDVRDFVWHEAAISMERAKRVTHRILYSYEELLALQAAGIYKNVGQLSEKNNDQAASDLSQREQTLYETDRGKDMIEVLEQWRRTKDGIRVTTFTKSGVLLADKPNPFWHGQFPFITCTAVPELFRIPGVSDVELIKDIQELIWTFLNQQADNVSLLNNAVVLIRADADDYAQFEWAPGAQWVVDDPAQVSLLQVPDTPAKVASEIQQRLLADLQNIPGASPALLGQIDNSAVTATEVSLTTSLGQRRIAGKKQQFKFAHNRVGEQWLANNQQFLSHDRDVSVVGEAGALAFERIQPLMIQGDYAIVLEALDESLLRQQRVAEAQSRMQAVMSMALPFSALSQTGQVRMFNPEKLLTDLLDAAGVTDTDAYFLAKAVPPTPGPGGGSSSGGGQGVNGVTAPQASDQMSVSNADSMNPATAMQQMLAMGGGPSNAPAG